MPSRAGQNGAAERIEGMIEARTVLGKRTVIVGETGSGKTRLTARILEGLLELVDASEVTVIDMAPTTIPGLGYRLSHYTSAVHRVRYLAPREVRAPRLEGRSVEEVIQLAEFNRNVLESLLELFRKDPTRVLVVNDMTMYFHAGDPNKLAECALLAETFLANAYSGLKLSNDKGSGLTRRESEALKYFVERVNADVYYL
ncbi:DUF87 domain-containing protein [Infirmifilum lucidum]|uniref:DUF87 domain-containing protein n=1 Tax=Infirmifilum lucidum TaxID=2776706 RepID=A0A7L9FFY9_9CREN|nr:DUF87 domain-containing protein [Infirmifilum lucidum]QOJ78710.1 DUF87 domain-containing protein [Infirmifilum lucidum]